ncbi:MAG TPA: D-2-hydroxyacid dehydrogenase [Bryobacteraceae bacterium]|nr:D-2-hydroxyacid dehydrogenase [Bryobacteraceae bacterium]
MDPITVLVLADPTEPRLAMLEELPPETGIAVGNSAEAFVGAAPDATVILNWSLIGDLQREVFRMCPKVEWVHTRSAGLDGLLFPELVESPVRFTNGSGVYSESLGEFAMGAILYFAKDLRRMIRNQAAGVWEQFDIVEVSGQTMGIVGYGDIGRAVARRARALGMRVLGMKRHGPPAGEADPFAERIYGPEGMVEMIARSDYVVAAAPLTPETVGLIGVAEIAAMKPDAVFINVGRGPVVQEAALVKALSEKRIKGAALDVFETEPLPAGHPFYKLENVLLSPHCADHTPDWLDQAMRFFLAQFERFRKGEPLKNVVDKKLGY